MDKDKALLPEASSGIIVCGPLTSVTIFFTGILIAQIEKFNTAIRLPILLLIIATLSFLFSMIIYANTSGIHRRGQSDPNKNILLANALSEYLGLYSLVFSIPMVINAVVTDNLLRPAVLLITLTFFLSYNFSDYSIVRRNYKGFNKFITAALVALNILIYLLQNKTLNIFFTIGILLIVFQIVLFGLALVKGEYSSGSSQHKT